MGDPTPIPKRFDYLSFEEFFERRDLNLRTLLLRSCHLEFQLCPPSSSRGAFALAITISVGASLPRIRACNNCCMILLQRRGEVQFGVKNFKNVKRELLKDIFTNDLPL